MIRLGRVIVGVVALVALSGCAAEPNIEAQRDELVDIVHDLGEVIYSDGIPVSEILAEKSLCDPREGETRRTRENYTGLWQSTRDAYGATASKDSEAVFQKHGIDPEVDIDVREPEGAWDDGSTQYTLTHDFPAGGRVWLRIYESPDTTRFQLRASTECATVTEG